MQGLHDFIPTQTKIEYINGLLACGFDTIDFGSFVSPKAIPQLRDTAEVLDGLNVSPSKLLAIVANERGANEAASFDRIDYLGYPFSVSEEFQKRNTNATIEESLGRVEAIQNTAAKANKEVVLYLSMGFGNPYGETWHPDIVAKWSQKLYDDLGIKIMALSDTIGVASQDTIEDLFTTLIKEFPNVEFGAHLHTVPENAAALVSSAYGAGCRRFDGAIKGFGGCPMASDDLTGNMPTEIMKLWFDTKGIETGLDTKAFERSIQQALRVFP